MILRAHVRRIEEIVAGLRIELQDNLPDEHGPPGSWIRVANYARWLRLEAQKLERMAKHQSAV